ncbi:MAG: lysophospholipid acyltransferase family protein [Alicyclobacillaceae bacterium]|nr:lysophospholipid acyltransferase family protein [Alicyclobacillaceae bacterium]
MIALTSKNMMYVNRYYHPVYLFCRYVVYVVLHVLFRICVVHPENVPREGGVILASNHIHNFDPPTVGITLSRYVSFMAKEELFALPVASSLLKTIGGFPVRRGGQDRSALRFSFDVLEQGGCLMMFPEGHRSKTGVLGKGMPGVAMIAKRSEKPIVPIGIIGSYKIFSKVTIRFGTPYYASPSESNQEIVNTLMNKIQQLVDLGHEEGKRTFGD